MKNLFKHMTFSQCYASITKIANAGLSSTEETEAARHKNWQMNMHYQIESDEMHKKCHAAQVYTVSKTVFVHNVLFYIL